MNKILLVLIFAFAVNIASAQIATIHGCVIDSVTGRVIEGATISIGEYSGNNKVYGGRFIDGSESDSEGNFECSGMVIGKLYKVCIGHTDGWNTMHYIKIQSVRMRLNFIITTKSSGIL